MNRLVFFFLFAAGCTSRVSPWKFDLLDAGLAEYNCAKLTYSDEKNSSPLRFEMTRIGYEMASYIYIIQYKLGDGASIKVGLQDEDELYEEETPLLEGRMRLRLSKTMTDKLVTALQEGRRVKLVLDGFEQTLESENFLPLYQRLVKNSEFLQNIIQGIGK